MKRYFDLFAGFCYSYIYTKYISYFSFRSCRVKSILKTCIKARIKSGWLKRKSSQIQDVGFIFSYLKISLYFFALKCARIYTHVLHLLFFLKYYHVRHFLNPKNYIEQIKNNQLNTNILKLSKTFTV